MEIDPGSARRGWGRDWGRPVPRGRADPKAAELGVTPGKGSGADGRPQRWGAAGAGRPRLGEKPEVVGERLGLQREAPF